MTKQLGEALRQVQEAVIRGVYEKMKEIEHKPKPILGFEYKPTPRYTPLYQQVRSRHPQRDENALQRGDRALHELADQGHLNRYLRRGEGGDRNRHDLKGKKDNDVDCNTEIIATIVGGIDDRELNMGYRKAQIRKLSQVIAIRELNPPVGPIVTFGPKNMRPLQTPHNDALVMQLKISTAMVP
ncbi:hypothetical protein Cgig2_032299 [Carnegiea gigantea]|uniref:Uncharacterized protein n=1 Tax=Carnegiea gigantea TaxID=171969 RepID=A0A9Q1Q7F9_9CARY|nr:hypothetical protein Cgig2_032299 [Carnegiea gigantea]